MQKMGKKHINAPEYWSWLHGVNKQSHLHSSWKWKLIQKLRFSFNHSHTHTHMFNDCFINSNFQVKYSTEFSRIHFFFSTEHDAKFILVWKYLLWFLKINIQVHWTFAKIFNECFALFISGSAIYLFSL